VIQVIKKEPILQIRTDIMIAKHVYDKTFTVRFRDRSDWKDGFQPDCKGGLIWYADDSKKNNKGTGAGLYGYGTKWKLIFSLGQRTTAFPEEVYANKACAVKNLDRKYRKRNIYMSQIITPQLKHLIIPRSTQNWFAIAISS
jgi:hypothetical protein